LHEILFLNTSSTAGRDVKGGFARLHFSFAVERKRSNQHVLLALAEMGEVVYYKV
jgi:hypothetical protein